MPCKTAHHGIYLSCSFCQTWVNCRRDPATNNRIRRRGNMRIANHRIAKRKWSCKTCFFLFNRLEVGSDLAVFFQPFKGLFTTSGLGVIIFYSLWMPAIVIYQLKFIQNPPQPKRNGFKRLQDRCDKEFREVRTMVCDLSSAGIKEIPWCRLM